MTSDEIGTLGQDLLKGWFSQARITAIPASTDKHGWDLFIQLRVEGGPHDAPERSCKVQVKTTTTDSPTADIKLSNWERMAKERLPWFVLHIVLDDARVEAREAYLVHIDETQVARALERLRKLAPDEEPHRVRMSLTAHNDDALAQPFYASLNERLLRDVGSSEEAYVAEKDRWVKETGYEDHPYTYSVSMLAPDEATTLNKIADWAVGLVDTLPLASMKAVETRFGVSVPVSDLTSTDGTMKFITLPSLGTSSVVLSNRDRSSSVTFRCTTHVARAIAPFLPVEYERIRFVGPYISFLQVPAGGGDAIMSVRFRVPKGGAPLALSELAKGCKAVRLLAGARERGLRAEMLWPTGAKSATDLSMASFAPDAEFQRFATVMESAAAIAKQLDLDNDITVDPGQLLANDFGVRLLAAAFDRTVGDWDLRFGTQATESAHGKRAAAILSAEVPLGADVAVGIFALVGVANWARVDDGTSTIKIEKPEVRLCFKAALPTSECTDDASRARIAAIVRQLEAEGIDVIVS
jgi:hypothetical protein